MRVCFAVKGDCVSAELEDCDKIRVMRTGKLDRLSDEGRLLRILALVIVLCAGVLVTSSSAEAGTPIVTPKDLTFTAPQSGFGGYNWLGKVKEIGAQWKVPAIYKNSRAGDAATWIGAQNDGGNDFIQLGTLEDLDLTGAVQYEAFWSDSAVNFTPQDLGVIKAGDNVSVEMVRKGFGWSLRLEDHASNLSVNRQIDYGFEDPFNQGEWIEENPSSSYNGLPVLPYPGMENIKFQDLAVNGEAPKLSFDDAVVLITSSVRYRVPTPIHNDSFSLQLPTSTQLRLLNDLRPSDLEATVFANEFSTWSNASAKQRAAEISTFLDALDKTSKSLAHQKWPSASDASVRRFVNGCVEEDRLMKDWGAASSEKSGAAFTKWATSELERDYFADLVRESLGLPPAY